MQILASSVTKSIHGGDKESRKQTKLIHPDTVTTQWNLVHKQIKDYTTLDTSVSLRIEERWQTVGMVNLILSSLMAWGSTKTKVNGRGFSMHECKEHWSSSEPILFRILNTRHAIAFDMAALGNVTQHLMIAGIDGTNRRMVEARVTPMDALYENHSEWRKSKWNRHYDLQIVKLASSQYGSWHHRAF